MEKYACTLLFQFNRDTSTKVKRLCETRIFKMIASSPELAYIQSLDIGKREEYECDYDTYVERYEFVGVMELVELSCSDDEDEIWHQFKEMLSPMERKDKIIPAKERLNVFSRNKRFSHQ